MDKKLRITSAQINPRVGDFEHNANRILKAYQEHKNSDLVTFTEMVVAGYPVGDLVFREDFIERAMQTAHDLAIHTKDSAAMLISLPWKDAADGKVYNAAALLDDGVVQEVRYKHELPNYGVFDEKRHFAKGSLPLPIEFRGVNLGVLTCEDMWHPNVAQHLKDNGAEILIALNGSPYESGKTQTRKKQAQARVAETGLPLIYNNQIGGQDELVFDGASFVLDNKGQTITQQPMHKEHASTTEWGLQNGKLACTSCEQPNVWPTGLEADYQALTLGLRDYVRKTGFKSVVLGMSGGVDSALVAAIAVDALGAENVHTYMLPSPYTSGTSVKDATDCCALLGITQHASASIKDSVTAIENMMDSVGLKSSGLTAENMQARLRGVFLMAASNLNGHMVLSTGNKSEVAVGYATLYGDMCGGFNPLKDVYKTKVFDLCRWRNQHKPEIGHGPEGQVIPNNIIDKPPSAELSPDQQDSDSLPPYEILDPLLERMIDHDMSTQEIINDGFDEKTVHDIWRLVMIAEYKRQQSCPGTKITDRAFKGDRRFPIAHDHKIAQTTAYKK